MSHKDSKMKDADKHKPGETHTKLRSKSLSMRRESCDIPTESDFKFKRRPSLPTSPWGRRRSFLSTSMMSNETHSVYEVSYCFNQPPTFIMGLQESQGFVWNQDLFASQHQQAKSVRLNRILRRHSSTGHNVVNSRISPCVPLDEDPFEESDHEGIRVSEVVINNESSDSENEATAT
ncbi:Hypothetical protein PP7435_CHR1-1192 [Komagataella phaffii CBS 7435]|uniref:Uncharacterized protein n=2 Tax=Komagataella phaffii TaxID=460519 RepID=C4QYC7_KOMPG|nr:Hypothetical protein PAS_chr1-4_0402 [Komagataella phaffii GS115]AOA60872.1 GQ67_01760T0 [Komagataella phaffii]CAH2447073.1 Hypothetical protein BQ9382_C1-6275 [Komagataella phaffii CBS 7435]AOA66416.1 GQ68_01775T0 [Komagataella phaffii GS115]CAY68250.1 Hypothetical protein PAS_chr1-4_0402 [Komagataella phaffii GS115]CCA37320.1 Hypothetical protein PP7435_CHR1-1192 [Komagataella phaffii CBS 7435]